jgi:hypothetical protein
MLTQLLQQQQDHQQLPQQVDSEFISGLEAGA